MTVPVRDFAGTLRRKLIFKQASETAGDAAISEATVVTLWGALTALGTSGAGGILADADYRFSCRYVAGLTLHLVAYDEEGRKFFLRSVQDPDGRHRELVILLREVVAQA